MLLVCSRNHSNPDKQGNRGNHVTITAVVALVTEVE
jgi:hypothetical protein